MKYTMKELGEASVVIIILFGIMLFWGAIIYITLHFIIKWW